MALHQAALLSVLVTAGCATDPGWNDDVVIGLHQLQSRVRLIELGQEVVPLTPAEMAAVSENFTDRDCMALKVNLEFGRKLTSEELDEAVAYARSPDDASIRWLLSRSLVDRGHFDAAAELLVLDVVVHPEDASQRVSNWLRRGFQGRSDFADLSQKFTDALLRQFASGTPQTKLAVARIFGKDEAEAALAPDAFKQAIGYGQAAPGPR